MKDKNIPYFVAECTFYDRAPQIPDADLHVQSNSIMFYKEQLLNKLEKVVPEKYTKLVLLDGDIIFSAPDWLDQISSKLNTADIIQPYTKACWLYPDNTRIRAKKFSYAYAIANRLPSEPVNAYHPGFVWAMKRQIFRAIGGFYDKAFVGNGDILFVFSLLNTMPQSYIERHSPSKYILDTWQGYNTAVQAIKPTIGYLDMDVYHLFHGLRKHRQYVTRYEKINTLLSHNWDQDITTNEDGMYEFRNKDLSQIILDYFKGREEDVPLKIAMLPPKAPVV